MNVFKKRSDISLPPLPKPPTNEQIIEDIKSSTINDPAFLGVYKNFISLKFCKSGLILK